MWVDSNEPSDYTIDEAARVLESGHLLVAPTETRYGLLARSDSEEALTQLMRTKGRAADAPVAVFVRDNEQIATLGEMNHFARVLARRFLPGPLTLVLTARAGMKAPIVAGGKIGLRRSSCPVIERILSRVRIPVTATSANLAGAPECSRISEIAASFRYQVSLYLDGGELAAPVSTVVDCSTEPPTVLRVGAISESEILDGLKTGSDHE